MESASFAGAGLRHLHGQDLIAVKAQIVDAQHAMAALQIADNAPMVDHAPIVRAGDIQVADVARAVGEIRGCEDDLALGGDGQRIAGMAGAGAVGAVGPVAFRPDEVIHAVSLEHAGAFHIALRGDLPEAAAILKGNEAVHGFIHDGDIAVAPAAVVEIDGAVVILEQMRVDGLRAVDESIHQRFARVTDEGAGGVIRYGDFQTADLVVILNVVAGEDEVVFAAFFDDGRRPHRLMDIGIAGHIDDVFVLFPVNQIFGGKGVQVHLILVGGEGLCDIDPVAALIKTGLRVGVPAARDGVHVFPPLFMGMDMAEWN